MYMEAVAKSSVAVRKRAEKNFKFQNFLVDLDLKILKSFE